MNKFGRQDYIANLSVNKDALEEQPENNYWLGTKVSYVFDNTLPDGTNILNGVRLKFYNEFFYNYNEQELMTIIGGDVRAYQKIFKSFIWANRVAFASSRVVCASQLPCFPN